MGQDLGFIYNGQILCGSQCGRNLGFNVGMLMTVLGGGWICHGLAKLEEPTEILKPHFKILCSVSFLVGHLCY